MSAHAYILLCADSRYYVGSTIGSLERRLSEHNLGTHDGWTKHRRPVRLVFAQEFQQIGDAIAAERQLKGWSRAKKEALIAGKFHLLPELARRGRRARAPFFETPPDGGSSG